MEEFFKKVFTKENMKKFFFSFIWLAVVLIIVDQVTKWAVVKHFGVEAMASDLGVRTFDEMIPIIPNFLYIGGAINDGAAFSFKFTKNLIANRIIFAAISAIMSGLLIFYYVKEYKKLGAWLKVGLILMIAGALGNFIDRAFYWESTVGFSGVIDWIQVTFSKTAFFPTFNIADSALVVGVAILIVLFIIEEIKDSLKKAKEGEYKYSPKEREEMKKDGENQSK